MPNPRDLLPQPPWEGPPVPKVFVMRGPTPKEITAELPPEYVRARAALISVRVPPRVLFIHTVNPGGVLGKDFVGMTLLQEDYEDQILSVLAFGEPRPLWSVIDVSQLEANLLIPYDGEGIWAYPYFVYPEAVLAETKGKLDIMKALEGTSRWRKQFRVMWKRIPEEKQMEIEDYYGFHYEELSELFWELKGRK